MLKADGSKRGIKKERKELKEKKNMDRSVV